MALDTALERVLTAAWGVGGGLLLGLVVFAAGPASAEVDSLEAIEDRAVAFGKLPALWYPRLSPDGRRLVMVVQPRKLDFPVAVVHDFESKASKVVLTSEKDEFDLIECFWANDERLLCRFLGIGNYQGMRYAETRLVAIDADGSDLQVLMQSQARRNLAGTGSFAQFQDRVVDLLPDDRKQVLVGVPGERGQGLSRLDVYSGKLRSVKRPRDYVRVWITDGNAEPRVRLKWKDDERRWQHRAPDESKWETIDEERPGESVDDFAPVGFGDDPGRLFSFRRVQGRKALVSDDVVGDGPRQIVFAHDEVDVDGVRTLGPHDRIVAATWHTERPHVTYFDPALERVSAAVKQALPGKVIVIEDESWDRETYLIFAYSDVDPWSWYRLDVETRRLEPIGQKRPALRGRLLSPMRAIEHPAADGTMIPGYVTRPVDAGDGPLPTVVLPHGGPASRDEWGFDWLAQYFAASGYVVFQTNYRGSFGYGADWIGEGAFPAWPRVVSDIDTGLQYLIDQGITDPARVCAVGWSFGGYAALLSVLEHPERYRCVVDIAGVTDPGELIERSKKFANEEYVREMVSRSPEVLKQGSPVHRAEEIDVPVLIFHPDEDLNVDVEHGRKLHEALKKADKQVEYVEYEDDEHGIWRHASRIDMLMRIGVFLDEHLAAPPPAAAAASR